MSACLCVSVPRNLRGYFVSILVEPITRKNMRASDEHSLRFSKNIFVAHGCVKPN